MRGLSIQCFNLDTTDPGRIASFWEEALGWRRTYDTPDEVVLEPPAGSPQDGVSPDLLFARAGGPDPKRPLALRPAPDGPGRGGGATGRTRRDPGRRRAGRRCVAVVMAYPDGNAFCVLRAFAADERTEIAAEAAAKHQAPQNGYRTSNPASPVGVSGDTETPVTEADGGPSQHQSTSACTARSSPSSSASTEPAAVLRTQPLTPSRRASRRHESRKNTPCTRPVTSTWTRIRSL